MHVASMPRRRLIALLGAGAIIVGACSSGSASSAPSAAQSAAASAPAPSSQASTPASSASGGSGDLAGQSVSVIGTWTGAEQESFLAMTKPWSDKTGATVKYTGTRDINAILSTGIQSGLLPDLAGLPGPGQAAEYVKAGALKPLDDVVDMASYTADTAPGLVKLGTIDGKLYGIFIKADVKGLFWYNTGVYKGGTPSSYDDLLAKGKSTAGTIGGDAKTFCVGLESGAASGWPGSDWVEQFVLQQSGPDVYDSWVAGKTKWTDPAIKQAFTSFGDVIANTYGGGKNANATNFVASGDKLFSKPPGCVFVNHGTFITDAFKKTGGATDGQFDFIPFPQINPSYAGAVEGSGDMFGMFNDTPAAKSLIAWLATPEAQSIWVGRGGALSANKQVSNYPNDILKKAAAALTNASVFRFDGGDNMPQAMNDAFFKAIVSYAQDPSKLDSILANLDSVQASSYSQ